MTTTPPTVAAAEAALVEAKQQEKAAQKAAEQHARDYERRVAELAKASEPAVRELKRRVDEALAEPDSSVPPLGTRRVARGFLRGTLVLPELMEGADLVVQVDHSAARLYGLSVESARVLDRLTDMATAAVWLPGDHPLVVTADESERRSWAAFIERVKVCACE